jgi:hypothetical protein
LYAGPILILLACSKIFYIIADVNEDEGDDNDDDDDCIVMYNCNIISPLKILLVCIDKTGVLCSSRPDVNRGRSAVEHYEAMDLITIVWIEELNTL